MGSTDEKPDTEALFEESDGPHLVEIGNWLAKSLDVSGLKDEHVLLLYRVLDRSLIALWDSFHDVLRPLAESLLTQLLDDDDEADVLRPLVERLLAQLPDDDDEADDDEADDDEADDDEADDDEADDEADDDEADDE